MGANCFGNRFWKLIFFNGWPLLGVAEVFLAKANKIALYPTGIAATLISIYILFTVGLYAECLLNGYYVVMSVYGWWHWADRKQSPVKVSWCNRGEWTAVLAIVFIGLGLLYVVLQILHPFHCTALGCMGDSHCVGGYVAACQTKDRKLGLIEYLQCVCYTPVDS